MKIMALCWPLKTSMSCKAVLMSLADNANDEGHCWPSIPTIAERTCMTERSVTRAIGQLEDEGLVAVDRSNGRHSKYQLPIEPPTQSQGLVVADGAESYPQPPTHRHPRQVVTPDTVSSTPDTVSGDPRQSVRGPPTQCPPNPKEPKENPKGTQSKRERAETVSLDRMVLEGCDRQRAKDWLAVRLSKRAPLTETAWEGLKREALTAGVSVPDAVRMAAESNWQTFKAEYIANRRNGVKATPTEKRRATIDAFLAQGELHESH